MTRRSFTEHRGRRPGLLALALILLLAAGGLRAHPEYQAQIDAMEAALGESEPGADWLLQRGDLYRRDGDFTAAARDFAAARALDPDLPMLDLYEARLKLDRGDNRGAADQLGVFLGDHPDHVVARTLRGDAWWKLAEPARAAADYGQSIQYSKSPAPALYLQRAWALIDAGGNHLEEAAGVLADAVRNFPGEASLAGLACDLALAQGSADLAEAYLSSVPGPMLQLPTWEARENLLRELNSGHADRAQSSAANSLQSQLDAFRP